MPTILTRGLGGVAGGLTTRGLASGTAVVVLPATLLAALKAYWTGASGLSTTVGPLVTGRANPGRTTAAPWCLGQQGKTARKWDVLRGYYELRPVTLTVKASTESAADLTAETLISVFDAAPRSALAFDRGAIVQFRRTDDGMSVNAGLGPGNYPVFERMVSFVAVVVRP